MYDNGVWFVDRFWGLDTPTTFYCDGLTALRAMREVDLTSTAVALFETLSGGGWEDDWWRT